MSLPIFIFLFFLTPPLFLTDEILQFNPDGKFKILQVADAHFENGAFSKCRDISESPYKCNGLNTTQFLKNVINLEKPDLVVYTGDNIDGGALDAHLSMKEIFKPPIEAKTYFAAVLGNHDEQAEFRFYSRRDLVEYIANMDYSLTEIGPSNLRGGGTYKLQVFDGDVPKFDLLMLDSMDWSSIEPVGVYDWMHIEKVEWYIENVDGEIPGIGFFHIPLMEYNELLEAGVKIVGENNEKVCSSTVNSGLYAQYLFQKNIKANFVGHDHINDYCADYSGIQLCYGGGCGYNTYGKIGWPRRMRLIEIRDKGDSLYTWKRLDDGTFTEIDYELLWKK